MEEQSKLVLYDWDIARENELWCIHKLVHQMSFGNITQFVINRWPFEQPGGREVDRWPRNQFALIEDIERQLTPLGANDDSDWIIVKVPPVFLYGAYHIEHTPTNPSYARCPSSGFYPSLDAIQSSEALSSFVKAGTCV